MMLLKRTLFGVMQCVYTVRGSKNTLFSTYCTLLLLLYAPPFWNMPIFTKLIVLRSEVCSDWPAIRCVVIGRIPQACDGNVTPLPMLWCRVPAFLQSMVPARRDQNNKTRYKRGICCIQWGHNYWLQWLIRSFYALRRVNIMSAFVIIETPNKHYTQLKTRVWIVSSKFFKYQNVLTDCESEAPDCPCDFGIAVHSHS